MINQNELVSVVIPVFNADKYLRLCLEKVKNQKHLNMEVLLVDDGSTDKSGIICDEFAKEDNRFKVFHNTNHGVSFSRNFGLKKSRGKYIVFFDSDDYPEVEFISKMLICLKENKCEMVQCLNKNIFETHESITTAKNKKNMYNVRDKKDLFMLYENVLTPALWNKIFIKDKITCGFDESISYGEDDLFILNYLKNINNVYFLNECLYNYRIGLSQSLTERANTNLLNLFKSLQEQRENLLLEICNSKLALKALNISNIRQLTIQLEVAIKNGCSKQQFKNTFDQIICDAYFKNVLRNSKARNIKEFAIKLFFKFKLSCALFIVLKRK